MAEKTEEFEIATLGRSFRIGDFYNFRSDVIIPETPSAWRTNVVLASAIPTVRPEFTITLNTSHSDNNIINLMGLDNHQKMNVMVGLVEEFSGASNCLDNGSNSWQVSRTLFCKVSSRKEFHRWQKVSQSLLSVLKECEMGSPFAAFTHIVRGFVYGAEAYCILTKDIGTGNEGIQESEKYLNGLMAKMKYGLENNHDLSQFQSQFEDPRKLIELNCRVYSDLETIGECSIFEAYDHFYNLIQEMKITTKENLKAVPISALLFPVTWFPVFKNQQARCKYRCIDASLIDHCSRVLTELDGAVAETEKFCLPVTELSECPLMGKFVWSILTFKQSMRTSLKNAVVDARHIDGNDDQVQRIVNDAENHPLFQKSRLERWLLNKKKELEIGKNIASLKKIAFLDSREELDKQLNSIHGTKYKCAFVLFIPPYEWTNGIVEAMTMAFIINHKSLGKVEKSGYDELPWYSEDQKWKQVMDEMQKLESLVKRSDYYGNRTTRYFIAVGETGKQFGFSYSIYESGNLVAENLNKLPSPPTGLRFFLQDSVDEPNKKLRVTWNHENDGYPECSFLVQHKEKDDFVWKEESANQKESIVVFKPNCVNHIRITTLTCIGRSKEGKTITIPNSALWTEKTPFRHEPEQNKNAE